VRPPEHGAAGRRNQYVSAVVSAPTQTIWQIDPSHSVVEFAVKHMMFATVKGRFAAFQGEIVTNPDDPTEGAVNVVIDADSIDTRDAKRDDHLRSNDFFGVGDNPQLIFRSTRVEHIPGPTFRVYGDLTMRGVTRPVVLDATFNGSGVNPWGQTVASWSATTEIDREDWDMNFNAALETGGVLVGTRIKLTLEVEAARQN
jgi:polyisoprenoid-binding protein YceI